MCSPLGHAVPIVDYAKLTEAGKVRCPSLSFTFEVEVEKPLQDNGVTV